MPLILHRPHDHVGKFVPSVMVRLIARTADTVTGIFSAADAKHVVGWSDARPAVTHTVVAASNSCARPVRPLAIS